MKRNVFKGENLKAISFPLGGIGSGSIGLAGNGTLIDWEIYNQPNKNTCNSFTNFAIKAEKDGKVVDARLLKGDTYDDFQGGYATCFGNSGFGHGVSRNFLPGLQHFKDVSFTGNYPIAGIDYKDEKFPGTVHLSAFNPFIPSNDKDSSMPCAFFEFEVENNTDENLDYTLAFSIGNPMKKFTVNKHFTENGLNGIQMTASTSGGKLVMKGANSVVATDAKEVSYQEYWYRSNWFDDVTTFWREFTTYGKLQNRHYNKPNMMGQDMCTLAAHIHIPAGQKDKVRFLLSWYFPIFERYWSLGIEKALSRMFLHGKQKFSWKNYYATIFSSSKDVTNYCFANWERLHGDTKLFCDALSHSSIPDEVYDAIQGTIAVLKSSTCMRLTDGSFYAFEGTNDKSGSCEGTCDHVWGYAYAMPYLFPALERSIRHTTYTNNMKKNGQIVFRTMLPVGSIFRPLSITSKIWKPCCDAQFGDIIKFYRDWKISGDDAFLKSHWPYVKKSMEFAWDPKNPFKWDAQKSGVIVGRQHHTLDVELFGPNSWLSGYYVGALFAMAEMAEYLGETANAKEYREIAERGKKYIDAHLFNGKHYIQEIDLKDKSILDKFKCTPYYWNKETEEIKYQIQDGCEIDQVVADWHTTLCGLPNVFEDAHRKTALENIYRLNFKSMRDISNPCRSYAVDDEKGVVMCEWDADKKKPSISIPYTEEVMTGFEYAVADTMLQNGMEGEALEIVRAVRDRYDGKKRNPWSEIECGSNYARAMATYSFLLTYSGFTFDMVKGHIGFNPIHFEKGYQTFWAVDGAFGTFSYDGEKLELKVLYGFLQLRSLGVPQNIKAVEKCVLNNQELKFEFSENPLNLNAPLNAGDALFVY